MSFTLTKESVTGLLIWWIEGADGSIEKEEEDAIEAGLKDLDFDIKTYRQETMIYVSGLTNDEIENLMDDAINWGRKHLSTHNKQKMIQLLSVLSKKGETTDDELKKLNRLRQEFKIG